MTISVRQRAWGPSYHQGGIAVLQDFEHPDFNLAVAYRRTVAGPYTSSSQPLSWVISHGD